MASESEWKKLRYFKKESRDKWGDVDAISAEHLFRLDDFRHYLGVPVYVTAGVSIGGHSKKSFHYRGNGACATDIVIPDYEGNFIDLILAAERFGFTGIGFYPHWKYNGRKVGGLHLDSRPLKWDKDFTYNYREARWMGILRNGSQVYIPLTYSNLLKYGGIYGDFKRGVSLD